MVSYSKKLVSSWTFLFSLKVKKKLLKLVSTS